MKKLSLIIFSVCLISLSICNVSAEEITYKRLPNMYFNLIVDGQTKSNYVTAFILGNRLAYCIEPGKDINTGNYDTYKDWSKINFSSDLKDYIEKLGYYGYEYPGHKTDRYYIATQELIWKAVKPVNIKWTTGINNTGTTINIEKEKSEILRLVNNHNQKPSFVDQLITGKTNEIKEIEDTNKVLKDYEIKSSNNNIQIEDNKLKIKFNDKQTDPEEIILTKKRYDSNTLLVYIKGDSQKLASLRLSSKEEIKFQIQTLEEPEEIVRVPSTADDDIIQKFNVKWAVKNNVKKFN